MACFDVYTLCFELGTYILHNQYLPKWVFGNQTYLIFGLYVFTPELGRSCWYVQFLCMPRRRGGGGGGGGDLGGRGFARGLPSVAMDGLVVWTPGGVLLWLQHGATICFSESCTVTDIPSETLKYYSFLMRSVTCAYQTILLKWWYIKCTFILISMVLTMQTIIAEGHAITINRPYRNITFRQENTRFWSPRSPILTQFISEYFYTFGYEIM